jgi:hypothetical protein
MKVSLTLETRNSSEWRLNKNKFLHQGKICINLNENTFDFIMESKSWLFKKS